MKELSVNLSSGESIENCINELKASINNSYTNGKMEPVVIAFGKSKMSFTDTTAVINMRTILKRRLELLSVKGS